MSKKESSPVNIMDIQRIEKEFSLFPESVRPYAARKWRCWLAPSFRV